MGSVIYMNVLQVTSAAMIKVHPLPKCYEYDSSSDLAKKNSLIVKRNPNGYASPLTHMKLSMRTTRHSA